MAMAVKTFASFWLVIISADSIHHVSGLGSIPTMPSKTSSHRDVCEDILPEEIENVIHQLDLVEEVEIRPPSKLVLLFTDDYKNSNNLFQKLTPIPDKDLKNIQFDNPSQEFLKTARESIFQFIENDTLYYIHPGMNEMKNEIFAKFLTYKLTDKARNIKFALINIVPDFVNNETNSNIRNAEMFFTNVSQYNGSIGLIQIRKEFTDFRYFVYNFDNEKQKNCDGCVKPNIFSKFDENATREENKIFSYQTTGDNFRNDFLRVINNTISFTKIEEKYLNFTFSPNQRSTRVLKCVESKLDKNLTSDSAEVARQTHAYFLNLEKNSTQVMNDFAQRSHSWRLKDESIREDHSYNVFVFQMKSIFQNYKIKDENGILSRIGRSMEQLRFLQSGRSDKVNSLQLFKPVNDIFDNNLSKTISFYKELHRLYGKAKRLLSKDSHVTIEQKLIDLWKQVDSEPDNVDVKKEALRDFKRSLLESTRECVLMEDMKSPNETEKVYKLKLHGDIIKFSNFFYYWDELCGGKTRYLEIFARDTIVIDENLNNHYKTLQIVAISPKLKVIGKRKIHLQLGVGAPEKSGGTFIGITGEIINGNSLRIFENGPGHNGGKGGKDSEAEYLMDNAGQIFICQLNDTSGLAINFRDLPRVVNDYKNFIRPHLNESEISGKLTDFYQKIINSESINKRYSTFGLLDELDGLEKDFSNLSKKIDFFDMYYNLQERIDAYARHRLDSESGEDYFVTLGYAYAVALIRSSRQRLSGNIYSSIYVQSFSEESILKLIRLRDNPIEYSESNPPSLGEEESLITRVEKVFESEMEKMKKLMESTFLELVNRILNIDMGENESNGLRYLTRQKSLSIILNSVSSAVSALISGNKVAAVVASDIEPKGNFFPLSSTNGLKTKLPTEAMKDFVEALEFVRKTKQGNFEIRERQIQFLDDGIKKLNTEENNSTSLVDAEKVLKVQLKKLKEEKLNESENGTDASKAIESINKLQGQLGKKERLERSFESIKHDWLKLQEYEEKIFEKILPVLENMLRDLTLDKEFHVPMIPKWKVQAALRDVKLIVTHLKKELKIENEMNPLIKSLEDTINILINMYDRIEYIQIDRRLAACIRTLNNEKFRNYHSSNKALENSILESRKKISENIALIKYSRVIDAFKQSVFPSPRAYNSDLLKKTDMLESLITDERRSSSEEE